MKSAQKETCDQAQKRRGVLLGVTCMTGAALSFAVMSALIKSASATLPPMQLVMFRGLFGVLVIGGAEIVRHGRLRRGGGRGRLLARSMAGFLALSAYAWAIANTHLGVASALNQSSPIFVALMALVFLRERPPLPVLVLIPVAFLGVTLVVAPNWTRVDFSALVGLSSGVLAAVSYVLVRALRGSDPPHVIIRWFSMTCFAGALPVVLLQGLVWPSGLLWPQLVGVAVFSLVGQFGMTYAYRFAEASLVAPFMYASVVASLALGWFVWAEWPGAGGIAGVVLIIASSVAIVRFGNVTPAIASPARAPDKRSAP